MADIFDGSNVNPVRLGNAHVVWMMPINNCKGMALESVQRGEALSDAWRNLESHCRAKGLERYIGCRTRLTGKQCKWRRTLFNS